MTKCQEYLRLRDGSAGMHRKAGRRGGTCTCNPALCGVDRWVARVYWPSVQFQVQGETQCQRHTKDRESKSRT